MAHQFKDATATVFLDKHANDSDLSCYDWKELGKDVAAYLMKQSSPTLLRLTNLPHRTKAKTLRKCFASLCPVAEVVKHSQVCRAAILAFEDDRAVQAVVDGQHRLKKLLGNRLIFTASSVTVKNISVKPVQGFSLSLPANYSAMTWHPNSGHFRHDITKSPSKVEINGENSHKLFEKKKRKDKNISESETIEEKVKDGCKTEWEYGEDVASNTICVVGLPADAKKKRLKKLLAECGGVVEVTLHRHRCPAHAYITMEDKAAVDKALETQCQFDDNSAQLLHFAVAKTVSAAFLTELLFQADTKHTDKSALVGDMFLSCLTRLITEADSKSSRKVSKRKSSQSVSNDQSQQSILGDQSLVATVEALMEPPVFVDPFELPPNTVFVVGGLGKSIKEDVRKAFTACGRVIYIQLLKETWPVHGYVTYARSDGVEQAVAEQPQVDHQLLTLTVATERKLTQRQIVELSEEHPKLFLDANTSATPAFYRSEFEAPSWTGTYRSRK